MKMNRKKIKKDDGRYLIYYTFAEERGEGDVRTEMESDSKGVGCDCDSQAGQDI